MGVPYAEVIGDPVAQSRSPVIHRFWLERLGVEGDYRATRVTVDELPAYLAERRVDPDWRGCNVTMPLKQAIVSLLDAAPRHLDAVNCVLPRNARLVGLNTDVDGIKEAISRWALPRFPTLCVIGGGGAAQALPAAFDDDIQPSFHFLVRDPGKVGARAEGATIFGFGEVGAAISGCHGLINASPLGMQGFPTMPDEVLNVLGQLEPGGAVLDMVTAPPDTALLKRAEELGLKTSDGLTMLIGQARTAFRHFFGLHPAAAMDVELRERLAS